MIWIGIPIVVIVLALCWPYIDPPSTERLEVKKFNFEYAGNLDRSFSFLHVRYLFCPLNILSDFHWTTTKGWKRMSKPLLENVMQQSQLLQPDFVFLTGDYVQNDWKAITEFAELSKGFVSKYGTFAVLGNHDYFQGAADEIAAELKKQGIIMLRNESFFPFGKDAGIEILGVDDTHRETHQQTQSEIFQSAQTKIPRVILTHRPDSATFLSLLPGSSIIQLSGHSHGGQVCLPSLSAPEKGGYPIFAVFQNIIQSLPFRKKAKSNSRSFDWNLGRAGLHSFGLDKNYFIHTTGGLATHPPARLFCPPEVSYFVVSPKNK
jgi:predicted MPP superfamily phosphohydrolase